VGIQGKLTNREIVERLSIRGLRLTVKNFRWALSNVFYAGYVTGKLLDHKLIKGHHPGLIDMKTFLKANELLVEASNAGVSKCPRQEELPLKVFAWEDVLGSPFTGYIEKGNWYYKAREKGWV
jgi:hypothetical protein